MQRSPLVAFFLLACSSQLDEQETPSGVSGNGSTGTSSGASAGVGTNAGTGRGNGTAMGGTTSNPSTGGSTATAGSTSMDPTQSDGGQNGCDVIALFQSSCAGMGCHEGPQPAAMVDLVSDGVEDRLVGVASNSCAGWNLVTAGSAELSLLYQKVALEEPQCGLRMPVTMPLPDAEVACIKQWIVDLGGEDPPPPCETCGTTTCIDLQTDSQFCGDCSNACNGEICVAGACQGCQAPEIACNSECVDTDSDLRHCGGCDQPCGGGEGCVSGSCACVASAAVSFASDVVPIFESSCANMGCHSGRRPQEGLGLTAAEAYAELVGVDSAQCTQVTPLVDPGNSSGSYLMSKLLGQDMCSGTLMPKGAQSLTDAEIEIIGAWICSGALDN